MQILTASWITNSGFATGLNPTIKITNLSTGNVSTYPMEEVGNGNYKYVFNDYKDSIVYFFNYDSGSDTTLNRYMSSSNNDVRVVYQQTSGGTNASINEEKKKEEKLIKKIADAVEERMEKDLKDYIDKKHKEIIGQFVGIGKTSDIEILSGGIDHLEEKTSLKIEKLEKAIKSIKIPKYDDTKLKALIEKVLTQIKDKTDIVIIQDSVKELLERLEGSKSELKEEIEQILNEDDVNMPQNITIEVDDKDDAESKAEMLVSLVSGNKKVSYIECRHEEGLPCIEENI